MYGAEVADIVRRTRPNLPTGYAGAAAVEAAVGASTVILEKPFQVLDLEAVLHGALGSCAAV